MRETIRSICWIALGAVYLFGMMNLWYSIGEKGSGGAGTFLLCLGIAGAIAPWWLIGDYQRSEDKREERMALDRSAKRNRP